jgi:multiple sugar transport system permease protein
MIQPKLTLVMPRSGARERKRFILLMLAPALVLLIGLTVMPFVVTVVLAFSNYSLIEPGDFALIGLENYRRMFSGSEFWVALRTTVLFTMLAVSVQLGLGVGLAALLHNETRAVPFLRLLFLVPMAITPVAAVFTFRLMLNPSLGVINYLARQLGVGPQDWLGTPTMALASLLLVDTWQWTPFVLLVTAGGLSALDETSLDAARMDGAGPFALFFDHTLRMLLPYISVAVVIRAIDAFKTFDIILVLTGGGPGIATRTLNLLAYKQGFEFLAVGYAAALAVVMLVMSIAASQVSLRRIALFRPRGLL